MFKKISSSIVYQNKWMSVHEDIIERKSGAAGLYGFTVKPHFAVIIAILDQKIQLVRQYRYPTKYVSLELPMGSWPEKPDADPMTLALGELQEETGYFANSIQHIGFQYVENGGSTQGYNIFFATDLEFIGNKLDAEEEDLVALEMTLPEFENAIISGEVKDSTSIAAYGLAKIKGLV